MGDIAILKEMLQDTATVPLEERNHKKQVTLAEPAPANYSVTLYGMPKEDEVIIIKADAFTSPNTVFKGKHGECKRADFIIIADTEKIKVILCIEMKAGKGDTEANIIKQLRVFQQINHPCFDAIAPNKALLARAGGLCPCSPTLQGAGFLKVLFFG
uniref:hypothetical protein n=1 Tax=Oscillatoria sp. HE19RPO TaxID=2954806 RepID=UPI0020C4BDE0